MKVAPHRPYVQNLRAESTEHTREEILDAVVWIFWRAPETRMTLNAIAERAGVTTQTVIRHFGGRNGAFSAALARESRRVRAHRDAVEPEEFGPAVRILMDHYESMGDGVLRMLAAESSSDEIAAICESGRQYHRSWCERLIGSRSRHLGPSERRRCLATVCAILDVYMWKLLRRDGGLSRNETEQSMFDLLESAMKTH